MIDLKKLEVRFKAFFEKETEESFNKWLVERKQREASAVLIDEQETDLMPTSTRYYFCISKHLGF